MIYEKKVNDVRHLFKTGASEVPAETDTQVTYAYATGTDVPTLTVTSDLRQAEDVDVNGKKFAGMKLFDSTHLDGAIVRAKAGADFVIPEGGFVPPVTMTTSAAPAPSFPSAPAPSEEDEEEDEVEDEEPTLTDFME